VEYKFGENLCEHKIRAYNNVEEMDFENISKLGNIVIKISNGCGDKIFLYKNKKYNFEMIKKRIRKNFEKDYGIGNAEFFHLYSRKRIVIEKMFYPLKDLYEFKFYVVNHLIKFIYIMVRYNNEIRCTYFDNNFKVFIKPKDFSLDMSIFDKNQINKLKDYAITVSRIFMLKMLILPNYLKTASSYLNSSLLKSFSSIYKVNKQVFSVK
jgi:hypothetical protein